MTTLPSVYRGDKFEFSFTCSWTAAQLPGGLKFTLREGVPESSVTDDADAVDQATTASGEITWSGSVVTVKIPASRTNTWPTGRLIWDVQGVDGDIPPGVYTIDSGTIVVQPDITRS